MTPEMTLYQLLKNGCIITFPNKFTLRRDGSYLIATPPLHSTAQERARPLTKEFFVQ